MRPVNKYMIGLGLLIAGILTSIYFEGDVRVFAKLIFESNFLSNVIATVAFSISLMHKIKYSSFRLHELSYEQFSEFGEMLFSLLAAPITVVGSWSLLSAYGLHTMYGIDRFIDFTPIALNFILLVASYFLISSSVKLWKQARELRKGVSRIKAVNEPNDTEGN